MEKPPQVHLEDVVVREGQEHPRGWDLDREFGDGMSLEVKRFLAEKALPKAQEEESLLDALKYDAWYYALFGKRLLSKSEEQKVLRQSRTTLQQELQKEHSRYALDTLVLWYRILSGENLATSKLLEDFKVDDRGDLLNPRRRIGEWRLLSDSLPEAPQEELDRALLDEQIFLARHLQEHRDRGALDATLWHVPANMIYYRAAKAHAVHFVPGRGIEFIDEPQAFVSKTEPIPEQRNF